MAKPDKPEGAIIAERLYDDGRRTTKVYVHGNGYRGNHKVRVRAKTSGKTWEGARIDNVEGKLWRMDVVYIGISPADDGREGGRPITPDEVAVTVTNPDYPTEPSDEIAVQVDDVP